jgi:hypothetical protein
VGHHAHEVEVEGLLDYNQVLDGALLFMKKRLLLLMYRKKGFVTKIFWEF